MGRGNSGLPQQARIWSGSRPLCPAGSLQFGKGWPQAPLPQPSHLVGWPHHSWEEPLWSAPSLVTGPWGWGCLLPKAEEPGCSNPGAKLGASVSEWVYGQAHPKARVVLGSSFLRASLS